jgi:glycosyltransferase involved in cell wall biosynthesis
MPSVSFIVPTISGPVLGPVTVLGKILSEHMPVQIVGPDMGDGVCPMYADAYDYTVVSTPRIYRYPDYWKESRELADAVTGEIIIAVKAAASTIPVAVRLKQKRGRKMVVYLDEWDGGLVTRMNPMQRCMARIKHLHHPGEDIHVPRIEKLIPHADEVVSTATFMQRKFGGRIIHMGVDPDFFKPANALRVAALKQQLGLKGKKLLVFGGVVRPHKGMDIVLEALRQMNRPDEIQLVIVGPETEHLRDLKANPAYSPYFTCIGSQPQEKMPEFLSLADAMVLPLIQDVISVSQVPCKVFEAMAMAKPIIASALSDLPEILDGCGRTVPPGDVTAMRAAIEAFVFDQPDEALRLGERARLRCCERYSKAQTEEALLQLIQDLS